MQFLTEFQNLAEFTELEYKSNYTVRHHNLWKRGKDRAVKLLSYRQIK